MLLTAYVVVFATLQLKFGAGRALDGEATRTDTASTNDRNRETRRTIILLLYNERAPFFFSMRFSLLSYHIV